MPMNRTLAARRKALGLTQEQVAAHLGVTAPAVSKWETGATSPDIALLPPLARLLQTDLNTLFDFAPTLPPQELRRFYNELADLVALIERYQAP